MKICKKCNIKKSISYFYTGRSVCAECFKEKARYKSLNKYNSLSDIEKKQLNIKLHIIHKNKINNLSEEAKEEYRNKKNNECKHFRLNLSIEQKNNINNNRKNRYNTDINFKLGCILRSRLNNAVKNIWKSGSAVSDLGCSIEEFITYIEKQFEPWMTWENHGKYDANKLTWQLDHINALANFNLSYREEFLKVAHYSNYKPLLALDNIKKSNKLPQEQVCH
jgi:hypothetical protein